MEAELMEIDFSIDHYLLFFKKIDFLIDQKWSIDFSIKEVGGT